MFPDRIRMFKEKLPGLYENFERMVGKSVAEQVEKFKFDDALRVPFWNILCLEWELADMDNQSK